MKSDQIFIGNIKICTKYEMHPTFKNSTFIDDQLIDCDCFGYIDEEDKLYKENAILLKIKNGGYVDLEKFNSVLDYIKIQKDITKNGYRLGGLMMPTSAHCLNSLFIDKNSLKPFFNEEQQKSNISIYQLKKQVKNNTK